MLELDTYHSNNDSQETIREDTKSGAGKFPLWGAGSWIKHSRHDELLHVTPRKIRDLKTAKANAEFECREPELRVIGACLDNHQFPE